MMAGATTALRGGPFFLIFLSLLTYITLNHNCLVSFPSTSNVPKADTVYPNLSNINLTITFPAKPNFSFVHYSMHLSLLPEPRSPRFHFIFISNFYFCDFPPGVCWLAIPHDFGPDGDVETNPGPPKFKFPCGLCSKPVTSRQRGIQCDSCVIWFHAKCVNISVRIYDALSKEEGEWSCFTCALPPPEMPLDNCSTALSQPSSDDVTRLQKAGKKSFVTAHLNVRSLTANIDKLRILVGELKNIDILGVSETKLDSHILDSEINITGYHLIRKDPSRESSALAFYIRSSLNFNVHSDLCY